MAHNEAVDVVLVGAGIMSATLAVLLKELDPGLKLEVVELMDSGAAESSNPWNNAGTGHAGLCELNYTPQAADGSIDIKKAVHINTTWVPGLASCLTCSMMPSMESQTVDGTVHSAAIAGRSQPKLAGAYQTTWSASLTLSGRPSRCAPSFMELERGSTIAMIGASPTRLRRPSSVVAIAALSAFKSVKRRMEKVADVNGITIYDDFAHHPTAIATTLDGLRKRVGDAPIIAIVEPRSNSMKLGAHRDGLPESVNDANQVVWYAPASLGWDLPAIAALCTVPSTVCDSIEGIIDHVKQLAKPGTHVVVMSNGGFGGLHGKLAEALK